jgi:hypothetical protein
VEVVGEEFMGDHGLHDINASWWMLVIMWVEMILGV